MATTVNWASPVWREDIADQESTARGAAVIQNDYIQRLLYQKAPPELSNEMIEIRSIFEEAMERLDKLKQCFPPEPR